MTNICVPKYVFVSVPFNFPKELNMVCKFTYRTSVLNNHFTYQCQSTQWILLHAWKHQLYRQVVALPSVDCIYWLKNKWMTERLFFSVTYGVKEFHSPCSVHLQFIKLNNSFIAIAVFYMVGLEKQLTKAQLYKVF